jgi:AraC family transcriptional regulator
VLTYILHRRLGQILLLLRQTKRPIVEIAFDSGFNDLPHFNRIFRREVGMTPREYRKQWQ